MQMMCQVRDVSNCGAGITYRKEDKMELKEKKTVDMLTPDGVSIMTSQLVSLDGEMVQIGDPHRRAYANSLSGRKEIQENEPEDVTQAVFAIWGDSPTIADDVEEDDTKE